MDSTVICVPCMLEHVCYEQFSFKDCISGRYLTVCLLVEFCVLSEIHIYKTRFKQINENLNIYACML